MARSETRRLFTGLRGITLAELDERAALLERVDTKHIATPGQLDRGPARRSRPVVAENLERRAQARAGVAHATRQRSGRGR
jgi:hypothetical protein